MPGGNGTGPAGMGPMTGRGLGFCSGNSQPGYMTRPGGGFWGFGGGRRGGGFGRGFRGFFGNGFFGFGGVGAYNNGIRQEMTPQQERDMLASQKDYLNSQIEALNERLNKLEGNQ